MVFNGYWAQPDQTASALPDGWFHTGDGAALDADGYLGISDRKKDVIITAGGPGASEVDEAALIRHCRARLAHYKCPSSVELSDVLARTATGKVQKFKLRAPYWADRDRLVS